MHSELTQVSQGSALKAQGWKSTAADKAISTKGNGSHRDRGGVQDCRVTEQADMQQQPALHGHVVAPQSPSSAAV